KKDDKMYGMTPMGVFFTAIFPLEINEQALCQQPQNVQKFIVIGQFLTGFLPRFRHGGSFLLMGKRKELPFSMQK
ncbi:hypothetical protein, partial [Flintibacter porci]|uniref:hypothetical protein n=1 Tax=Flintibacter porci TaxID=3342383 RepID=UPI003F8BAA2A